MGKENAAGRIARRGRFGQLGLERMHRVMAALGNPQETLRTAHIAGTNGKGSTAAFLDSIWRTAGLKTGLFTSPHVFDWRERVQINRRWIREDDLERQLDRIEGVLGEEGDDPLTTFETWTAAAFLQFREARVERAVIEVGLGGELDATNILRHPAVTAVVTVGFDHMGRLGSRLREIARQKAGIAKPGVPLVIGALPSEARAETVRHAREVGAPLFIFGEDFQGQWEDGDGIHFQGLGRDFRAPLGLIGHHQAHNAAVAVAAALLVDPGLDTAVLAEGLAQVWWPGRLDMVRKDPPVIVDGAKNPLGTETLRAVLDASYPRRPFRLLFGCLEERLPEALLAPLADRVERLALFPIPDERGLPADALRAAARTVGLPAEVLSDLREGVAFLEGTPPGGVGVATGSFYLVGPLLKAFGRKNGEEGP